MAVGKPTSTTVGTRDPGAAASLTADEQKAILDGDEADVSPRAATSIVAQRIRAIPTVITRNGDQSTRVEISRNDFRKKGIAHETIVFDFLHDNFTLPVGDHEGYVQKEAADFLTKNYPASFEYVKDE